MKTLPGIKDCRESRFLLYMDREALNCELSLVGGCSEPEDESQSIFEDDCVPKHLLLVFLDYFKAIYQKQDFSGVLNTFFSNLFISMCFVLDEPSKLDSSSLDTGVSFQFEG